MKKLLALCLVLALSSFAGAALQWQVTGDVTMGNTITLALVSTEGVCNGFNVSALSDGGIGGVVSAISTTGSVIGGGPYVDNTEAGILFDTYSAYFATPAATGTTIFQFNYTVAGVGEIRPLAPGMPFVDVYGDTYTAERSYATIGIEQFDIPSFPVPEPMTMSLLALGGLGLLRRRSA